MKVEMELFQHYRVADFKKIIVVYLEVSPECGHASLLVLTRVVQELTQTQLAMVAHWETFLPEIKRVG